MSLMIGGFRPEYMNIYVLRARIPVGAPLFGTSATITEDLLVELVKSCGFRDDTIVMRTALDRPEIHLQIEQAKHTMKGMLDLQCVLPEQATTAVDIPKTIIFMDSCAFIVEAVRLLRMWMENLGYPEESHTWVRLYFSSMPIRDKSAVSVSFHQISSECISTRILVATDAYGLGIDNPDIVRVIQWQAPSTMSRLYQRLGRAMRNGTGPGSFLLIHQPNLVGPRDFSSKQKKGKQAASQEPAIDPQQLESQDVNTQEVDLYPNESVDLSSKVGKSEVLRSEANSSAMRRAAFGHGLCLFVGFG